jgi:hypothetical protein
MRFEIEFQLNSHITLYAWLTANVSSKITHHC